jgi:uncharacterized membrane protein YbhN (UPF0104 family)
MHRAEAIAGRTAYEKTGHAAWLSWMLGGALLVAVIAAALHFSEERAFVRVVQDAEPWWLAVAVFLQVGTYVAQGHLAARGSRDRTPLVTTCSN